MAWAPYTFSPLPETIIKRYDDFEQLPSHDAREENAHKLLSGEITFDIKAETPLLVADRQAKGNKEHYHFVKNARGKYEIPGSTIRGLLRNTVSILSLSNWTDRIDEERFFYRTVAESETTLSKEYRNIVGAFIEDYRGKKMSIARNVKAGYLVKRGRNDYVIYPARTDGGRKGKSYYKYHVAFVHKKFQRQFKKNIESGFKVFDCRFNVTHSGYATYLNGRNAPFKGTLVFSGPMFGQNRKQSAYIINEIDKNAKPIPIRQKDLQAFKVDYEFKRTKFDKQKKKALEKYFSLPKEKGFKGAKPCFYIQHGELLSFGFTAFLRLLYTHSTKEALPKHLKELDLTIDYEKALFGFTKSDFKEYNTDHSLKNYASRLHFFPSELEGDSVKTVRKTVMLRSPRASAVSLYLKQELGGKDYKSYNDQDAEIQGMKQYWIKNISEEKEGDNHLHLLPEGTTFQVKIKFHQLYADELGLLLWALKAPKYQQIGMGKPYGYGVVTFLNLKCKGSQSKQKYQSLTNFYELGQEDLDVQMFIDQYKQFVKENCGIDLEKQESIQTFLRLKEPSPLKDKFMTYMPLKHGYSDKLKKLPTAKHLLENQYKNFQ